MLDEKNCNFFKQTGETANYRENSEPFPCLYYIPRISTAFSVMLIHFSPKSNNILLLFTFPFYTITETPDFCVKVYFCLIVRFLPQSPSYQRHPKTKKLGSTTHCDEPHQTSKSLDFKPFFNTFACKYQNSYGIISELPPVPLLYFDDFYPIYPTQFDIRQTGFDKLRSYRQNPYFSVRRNRIRAALKAVPTHAPRPYLMRSAWYRTAKSGCHGKMITAFPHFQLLRMLPCRQTYTVLFQSSSKPVQ